MFSQVTQFGSIYQLPPPVDSLQWCKILDQDDINITDISKDQGNPELDRLLPTLFECFAVVFCGFLAGRCNLISQSDIKGLNDFTTYFSLPPLIFLNLVTIDFHNVNWYFVLGILLGKISVFLLVAVVTALIYKPLNLSYAGIYGIFCTQGNDMGLAYPIVSSLYGTRRPLYAGYMYLIAPTSLLFTNPMGFFLMEMQKARTAIDSNAKNTKVLNTVLQMSATVSWSVFKNPVVFVTILGVLGNFLFHNGIPSLLYGVLQILSSAFSGSILFLLGFSAVKCANSKTSSKEGLLIPAVLIIAKMLVSPLITRGAVAILCANSADVNDLSDYGFLYGMVPTGPIVMLFAAEYCLKTEMMASTMVVCTALFAPMMFILARMLSLKMRGMEDFTDELRMTMLVIGILSIISIVWICLCMIIGKKYKTHIHKITICLFASQATLAIGILLWTTLQSSAVWVTFFEVGFISAGQLMSRLWTTLLALTLVLMKKNPNCPFVINTSWSMSFGFGIPAACVLMLLVLTGVGKCNPELHNALPFLIYGRSEAIVSTAILSVCLLVTTMSLVLYYRSLYEESADNKSRVMEFKECPKMPLSTQINLTLSDNSEKQNKASTQEAGLFSYELKTPENQENLETDVKNNDYSKDTNPTGATAMCEEAYNKENVYNYESKISLSSLDSLSIISDSRTGSSSSNSDDNDKDKKKHRYLRHVILLILCSISMAVGLTMSTWKLSDVQPNGLFFALEFLDIVLNVAQGFFVFVVFWRDSKYIIGPIRNWVRKLKRGFYFVDKDSTDNETVQLCRQFRTYHWENCLRDLPRTISTNEESYAQCFTGKELVEWLIKIGLTNHRTRAELYGQRLVSGGLLRSVNGAVQFHDNKAYFYQLVDYPAG